MQNKARSDRGKTGKVSLEDVLEAIRKVLPKAHGRTPTLATNLPPLTANAWREFTISFAALGLVNQADFNGFYLQDRTGTAQPSFYIDDVALLAVTNTPPATNSGVIIRIDVAANRRAIDPRIYGVAFASSNALKQLNAPLNRVLPGPVLRLLKLQQDGLLS